MRNKKKALIKKAKLIYTQYAKKVRLIAEALKKRYGKESDSMLRTKLTLAGISLLISVMIWSFVAWDGNIEGTKTISVPVSYTNVPSGYTLLKNTKNVDLRVAGRINVLTKLGVTEFKAQVDLAGLRAGKHKLPIKIDTPSFVRVRSWSPTIADLEIYRKIERTVPVTWRIKGKVPEGMVISSVEIVPSKVMIRGPEAEVLGMQKLEAVIPSEKLEGGKEFSVPVVLAGTDTFDEEKISITPEAVTVRVNMEEEILREKIPVEVALTGNLAEGLEVENVKITPDKIFVNGRAASVKSMKSLVLPPIDITGLDQNLQLMLPLQPLEKSPDIQIIGPDRARVDITVRKKVTNKTFQNVAIHLNGARPGSEWNLSPTSAAVIVEGGQLAVNALNSDQPPLELYVDVTNIVAPQLTLPILVRNLKKDFSVVQIEPSQVTVTAVE
jgi:YbbR domain-containing protein